MTIDIKLDDGAVLPSNAHPSDTGYDLVAASGPTIVGERTGDLWSRIDYIEYNTAVHVAPHPKAYAMSSDSRVHGYLLVYPRSSISKTNLMLTNGTAVIDASYRGPIKLRFRYIIQPFDLRILSPRESPWIMTHIDETRIYQQGDKIGQAVAAWKEDITWRVVDSLDQTSRSDGGFGSSGI